MALNSYSDKKDAAVEFIKYTVSPGAQKLAFDEFTNFPSRLSIAKQVTDAATGAKAEWLKGLETDHRQRQGMAEAAGLLEGLHDDVRRHRAGASATRCRRRIRSTRRRPRRSQIMTRAGAYK